MSFSGIRIDFMSMYIAYLDLATSNFFTFYFAKYIVEL